MGIINTSVLMQGYFSIKITHGNAIFLCYTSEQPFYDIQLNIISVNHVQMKTWNGNIRHQNRDNTMVKSVTYGDVQK